jgi:hypothetical protein
MSIPDRLWRLMRGHWLTLSDSSLAASDDLEFAPVGAAYQELAEALRAPAAAPAPSIGRSAPAQASAPGDEHDPLEACYLLIGLELGGGLAELDLAYGARIEELAPGRIPAGEAAATAAAARRDALSVAYERLRDAINTTETRFERLEL